MTGLALSGWRPFASICEVEIVYPVVAAVGVFAGPVNRVFHRAAHHTPSLVATRGVVTGGSPGFEVAYPFHKNYEDHSSGQIIISIVGDSAGLYPPLHTNIYSNTCHIYLKYAQIAGRNDQR